MGSQTKVYLIHILVFSLPKIWASQKLLAVPEEICGGNITYREIKQRKP